MCEGGGSSGIARSVLSRGASNMSVYMLRQLLRRETFVWLTRTLSCCFLVYTAASSGVCSSRQARSVLCFQPSVVLLYLKEHSGLPSGALALRENGLGMLACQESHLLHPSCVLGETNILNTAHLLMWVMHSYIRHGNLDCKHWQFKSVYGVF